MNVMHHRWTTVNAKRGSHAKRVIMTTCASPRKRTGRTVGTIRTANLAIAVHLTNASRCRAHDDDYDSDGDDYARAGDPV